MIRPITPESLEERGRGNGRRPGPGLNPAKAGNVAPNLPALRGGEEVRTKR